MRMPGDSFFFSSRPFFKPSFAESSFSKQVMAEPTQSWQEKAPEEPSSLSACGPCEDSLWQLTRASQGWMASQPPSIPASPQGVQTDSFSVSVRYQSATHTRTLLLPPCSSGGHCTHINSCSWMSGSLAPDWCLMDRHRH